MNQSAVTALMPQAATVDSAAEDARELALALKPFLATVVKLANAYAGAVRSLTPDGCMLRLVAAVGLPEDVMRQEAVVGSCGVCGEAARGDGVHVASDGSGCDKLALAAYFGKPRSGTIAVPLEYKGRTVGVFTLFIDGVEQLRAEVIHLLRPIGELLGLALENARLERDKVRASLDQERRTIAGEIHDSLAQSLTFVRMRMPLLTEAIDLQDRKRALGYCADVNDELVRANRRLRELITHFRTGMDAPGLQRALADIAGNFYSQTGIELEFESRDADFELPAGDQMQVYHIVREALANVRKHSGARHASVRLDCDGGLARITIEDDGAGVHTLPTAEAANDDDDAGPHFGFDIMRQRAKAVGGRIDVESVPNGGTRVRLTFPVASAAQRSAS